MIMLITNIMMIILRLNHNNKNDNKFKPIPLPEQVLQTSSCTVMFYELVLQTVLGIDPKITGIQGFQGYGSIHFSNRTPCSSNDVFLCCC